MAFRIIRNDITKVKADAIVNTANPDVAIGDGVDSAIYEAAGTKELLLARKKIGPLNIGEVGITPAFNLDAKYIIHVSGPYWIDGKHDEEEVLRRCYDKALELAYKKRCKSIAFPLLSTGTYGFSKEIGLKIALAAFNAFLILHEMEIILVVFGENAFRLSGKIFDDVREYVDNSYVEHKLQREYRHDGIPDVDREIGARERTRTRRGVLFGGQRSNADFDMDKPGVGRSAAADECQLSRREIKESNPVTLPKNLDDYMKQSRGTFTEYLRRLINKKGMKNSQVYGNANMTKQYFSKLMTGKVMPSKLRVLSLAIALRLNMDETMDLLKMSGYALSPYSESDKIFEYFILNGIYDAYRIDMVLFDYNLPTLINE